MAREIKISKLSDNANPYFSKGPLGKFTMVLGPSVGKSFEAYKGIRMGLWLIECRKLVNRITPAISLRRKA